MYRFGVFEADEHAGELRKQGRALKVRGRPFDILVALLKRPGAVVTREELRNHLWPADTFVDFDHGLNSAMNRLREALGDSAENPRFIETLPKKGYRFIAPVEMVVEAVAVGTMTAAAPAVVAAAPPPAVPQTPLTPVAPSLSRASRIVLLLAGGALAVAVVVAALYLRPSSTPVPGRMTLAVLPFENLSNDADQEFFSDGFTEEMIAELGKLDPEHLGVIARTTTMLYKGARKSVGQIRQELGVDYVLEGSIRRSGSRVRITAQLVRAREMTHLWSESYDRDVADSLSIQSEVAMKIAKSLELALRGPQTAAAPKSFPAYELTLRGRFYREQATEEGARKAIEYFQRAIAADPPYAPAFAGIADAYLLLGAPGWEVEQPGTLFQKAQSSAERALSIDMQSAEAHAVLAMLRLYYRWDRDGAEAEVKEAIRLNPNYAQAHQYYSTVLTTMGRFDDAIGEARRAIELDPLSAPAGTTLGIRLLYAGRCAPAAVQFSKTLESRPEFGVAHWGIAQCARESGDHAKELDELRRAVELSGNSAYMRAHLAYGLARADERDRATAIQRELDAEGRERYASPYHSALIAVGLDDRGTMVRALERAFTDRSGWMVFLAVEPEFAGARQTPEFQRLLARVRPQ
jgi:TolB-like protein/DNA-binding winged helix-turn-helix (wHTH) protein/tetratricopeptide (TPR) repeat protein